MVGPSETTAVSPPAPSVPVAAEAQGGAAHGERPRVRPASLVHLLWGTTTLALVLWAEVFARLDVAGLTWVLLAGLPTALGALVVVQRRTGARPGGPLGEALVLAAGALLALAAVARVTGGGLVPVSGSVDTAHHLAAVAHIADTGQLPTGAVANLGEMSSYPQASHLLAALAGHLTGLDPLRATQLAADAFLVLVTLGAVAAAWHLTARWGDGGGGRGTAAVRAAAVLLVPLLLAGVGGFGFGIVLVDFFFGQALGVAAVWAGVALLLDRDLDDRLRWAGVAVFAVLVVFCFPLHVAVVPAAAVATALAGRRHGARWWPGPAAVVAATAAAVLVYAAENTGTTREMVSVEGHLPDPTLANLGGVLVAVAAVGLLWTVVAARRGARARGALAAVVVALALPVLQAAVMRSVLRHVPVVDLDFSRYTALKNLYAAFPAVAVLAAVGLVGLVGAFGQVRALGRVGRDGRAAAAVPAPGQRRWAPWVSAVVVGAVAVTGAVLLGGRDRRDPIVDAAAYTLARDVAAASTADDVEVTGAGLGRYLLHIAGLGRARDTPRANCLVSEATACPRAGEPRVLGPRREVEALRDEYPHLVPERRRGRWVVARLGPADPAADELADPSFERGAEGWAPANRPDALTLAATEVGAGAAVDGTAVLRVTAAADNASFRQALRHYSTAGSRARARLSVRAVGDQPVAVVLALWEQCPAGRNAAQTATAEPGRWTTVDVVLDVQADDCTLAVETYVRVPAGGPGPVAVDVDAAGAAIVPPSAAS